MSETSVRLPRIDAWGYLSVLILALFFFTLMGLGEARTSGPSPTETTAASCPLSPERTGPEPTSCRFPDPRWLPWGWTDGASWVFAAPLQERSAKGEHESE